MWPYGRLWGDREERKAVRDYLKKVWKENITTWPVEEDTVETTRREKNSILNVSCNHIIQEQYSNNMYKYIAVVVERSLWAIRYSRNQ